MFLGIFGPGPNPSACFIEGSKILFWAEEERFTRIKTSPNSMPFNAITRGLKFLGAQLDDIKCIGYGWDCEHYEQEANNNLKSTQNKWPSESDYYNNVAQSKLNLIYNKKTIESGIQKFFIKNGSQHIPEIRFYKHHLCHAASAVALAEKKDELAIIVNDGAGEIISSSVFSFKREEQMQMIASTHLPHSLGSVYAALTEYLGYRAYEDEGRVMGLSCYGKENKAIEEIFRQIAWPLDNETMYSTDPTFRYNGKRTVGNRFSDKLVDALGMPRRQEEDPLSPRFANIAFGLQKMLEDILISQSRFVSLITGYREAVFSGGVHMNCKANGLIASSGIFETCMFQPAAADNGVSFGAALLAQKESNKENLLSEVSLTELYHGTLYTDDQIEETIKKCKLNYKKTATIAKDAAIAISENKIIGWFQGRMEVGARSLCARSILANAIGSKARDYVNTQVKNREYWRPFCPAIKQENFNDFFAEKRSKTNSEYMIVAFDVSNELGKDISSCIHIDNTVRPQSVSLQKNPLVWELLDEVEKRSGIPIVLNTSFNTKGEPIVESPEQAIRCFYGTGIDQLHIGSYIIYK